MIQVLIEKCKLHFLNFNFVSNLNFAQNIANLKKIGNGAIRHTTRHMWRVRMGWTTLLKRICLKHAARLMGFFSAHVIIKTPQIKADLAVLSSFAARGHICFVKM